MPLVPSFSWLAFGALGAAAGMILALGGSSSQRIAGVGLTSLGIGLVITQIRVYVELTDSQLIIQNRLSQRRFPLEQIARVSSGVTSTPLSRAVGWGQLRVEDRGGTATRIVATTGMSRDDAARFVRKMCSVPGAQPSVEVRLEDFPSLGR